MGSVLGLEYWLGNTGVIHGMVKVFEGRNNVPITNSHLSHTTQGSNNGSPIQHHHGGGHLLWLGDVKGNL